MQRSSDESPREADINKLYSDILRVNPDPDSAMDFMVILLSDVDPLEDLRGFATPISKKDEMAYQKMRKPARDRYTSNKFYANRFKRRNK